MQLPFQVCLANTLLQDQPDDYVIATGKTYSVKHFIDKAAKYLKLRLKWKGKGINTKAYDEKGNCIIECDKKYFRPTEVDALLGDASKARKILAWKPKVNIHELIKEMISYEM